MILTGGFVGLSNARGYIGTLLQTAASGESKGDPDRALFIVILMAGAAITVTIMSFGYGIMRMAERMTRPLYLELELAAQQRFLEGEPKTGDGVGILERLVQILADRVSGK
jgi:hypothetical protein